MIKTKFCGLSRLCDIEEVNILLPEYIGFVFAPGSRRFVSEDKAADLKSKLDSTISAVGVFVNEDPVQVSRLLNKGIIDIAQLHGNEDEAYIRQLRLLTDKPIIQAFQIVDSEGIKRANKSPADFILLDSGAGGGSIFDWRLTEEIERPYFLAGGLNLQNIERAINELKPYAVDVSSGIETQGYKDKEKMEAFIATVRRENTI